MMSGLAFAGADKESVPAIVSCGNGVPGGIDCAPTKNDLKQARLAYAHGVKLQERQQVQEAYEQFDAAVRLAPHDPMFFSAREMVKSQLVYQHTQRGDSLLADSRRELAAAEFKAALELDPDNAYDQERLADAAGRPASKAAGTSLQLEDSAEVQLQPKTERATFHYKGDVRGLFSELDQAFGVRTQFDDSVAAKNVRFYVDDVDFFTALRLACRVSKTMWAVLDAHELLIAADSTENHKQFDRMSLATLTVPGATTLQQSTEMVTALRNVCDFQKVSTGQTGIVEIRAPQATLAACSKLLRQFSDEQPEVMLDVDVFQVSHNFMREIGMHVPDTFNLYNIPAVALAGLGGQSITSLINQLISSGGINAAGSSALSGLLAQLQGQSNSIFSQPLATFGGGLTFEGLSLDHLTATLSLNES